MRHVHAHGVFMCVAVKETKNDKHVEAPIGVQLHNYRQALG